MSGASSRNKGKAAELAVVHALRRAGFEAETSRNVLGGQQRGSDIVTPLPVAIEVKDRATLDLAGWLRQAAESAGDRLPVVWHKRRGNGQAEDWYVTMSGATLLDLLKEAFGSEL